MTGTSATKAPMNVIAMRVSPAFQVVFQSETILKS